MNPVVLELAQKIADDHGLTLRDVVTRFRRAGIQFRTETQRTYDTEARDENTLIGFSFEGFFYPYSDEDNRATLEKLVLEAYPRERKATVAPEAVAEVSETAKA